MTSRARSIWDTVRLANPAAILVVAVPLLLAVAGIVLKEII